jgi:hypothetical protein
MRSMAWRPRWEWAEALVAPVCLWGGGYSAPRRVLRSRHGGRSALKARSAMTRRLRQQPRSAPRRLAAVSGTCGRSGAFGPTPPDPRSTWAKQFFPPTPPRSPPRPLSQSGALSGAITSRFARTLRPRLGRRRAQLADPQARRESPWLGAAPSRGQRPSAGSEETIAWTAAPGDGSFAEREGGRGRDVSRRRVARDARTDRGLGEASPGCLDPRPSSRAGRHDDRPIPHLGSRSESARQTNPGPVSPLGSPGRTRS